jgi:hypothetical protein
MLDYTFLFSSRPDLTQRIRHVWKGEFVLPFRIHVLGSPHRRLPWEEARKILPIDNVGPSRVFSPYKVGRDHWETILERLADI